MPDINYRSAKNRALMNLYSISFAGNFDIKPIYPWISY